MSGTKRFWGRLGRTTVRVIAAPIIVPRRVLRAAKERTMQAILASLVRHVLTMFGGALVTNGTISGTELETVIGAAIAITGIIWAVVSKRKTTTTTGGQ